MENSIRLEGDIEGLKRKLKKLQNIDLKGINQSLSESLRSSTMKRFKDQEDPSGRKWKPSIRASEGRGVTLVDTARLKNSIKSAATQEGFAIGTNTIYARTQQFGDSRKITIRAKTPKGLVFKVNGHWYRKNEVTVHTKIPARPFLGISEEDQKEIKATLEKVLQED